MIIQALAALSLITNGMVTEAAEANPDAKRLYDDLLSNYNRYKTFLTSRSFNSLNCPFQTHSTRGQQFRSIDSQDWSEALANHWR